MIPHKRERQKPDENRRTKRYRYSAEATLRHLECELTFPGVLLDLSHRGCLIRLIDSADIEIGTFLDLTVNSNAVAFRALGEVRHCSRKPCLIGISFVNLNRRGPADVRDLIAELESHQQSKRSAERSIHRTTPRPWPDGAQS
jgi:hypothetical protein